MGPKSHKLPLQEPSPYVFVGLKSHKLLFQEPSASVFVGPKSDKLPFQEPSPYVFVGPKSHKLPFQEPSLSLLISFFFISYLSKIICRGRPFRSVSVDLFVLSSILVPSFLSPISRGRPFRSVSANLHILNPFLQSYNIVCRGRPCRSVSANFFCLQFLFTTTPAFFFNFICRGRPFRSVSANNTLLPPLTFPTLPLLSLTVPTQTFGSLISNLYKSRIHDAVRQPPP